DFLSNFDNDRETLHVYDLDGNEITDETITISTSMTLKLIIDNKEYDELTIVVRGDINSDGVVNINDYNKLNSRLLKMIELNYIETQASDLNYDGIVNINDYSKLNSFLLKLLTTLN
ncbi:MAG: hypothetical protein HFI09_04040, partial [Bacilli bacterium]|nr:hypothetical protein [Bacilli bacterium]